MVPPASTSVQEFPFIRVVASVFLPSIVTFDASVVLKKTSFMDGSAYSHPTCCICQVCESPDSVKEPPHSGSSPSSNDLKWDRPVEPGRACAGWGPRRRIAATIAATSDVL